MRSSAGIIALIAAAELCVSLAAPCTASAETHADYDEPSQSDEKNFRRDGFAIGVSLGSAILLGSGKKNELRGVSGAFGIRLGTTAGEKLLWFAQLDGATRTDGSGASLLSVAAHYYVREAIWLRGGAGFSSATQRVANLAGEVEAQTDGGLALVGGAGVDIFRRGIFAVDLELSLSRAFYGNGRVNVGTFQVAVNWY